jgi:UDP-3-O-[3-hydroxymyristoyl] glucosamine N-acyltransferase
MIHETAIIGGDPFWYIRDPETGKREMIEGEDLGVFIGDDVDIFSLAIVVRGVKRQTRIEKGAKISHRAQIGHDVVIGENSVIGCRVTICGLSTIGKRCTFGVGAIVTPDVTVGDDCFIGAGVVVSEDLPANTKITIKGCRQNWDHLPWCGIRR